MSLEKTVKPYEIMVRFRQDGKVGASFQEIVRFAEDGEPVSGRLEAPVDLTLSELQEKIGALTPEDWYVAPEVTEE